MQRTLPLPAQISTNVRFLIRTAARRLGLRAAALLAPGFAEAWAERMFLTPPRPRDLESTFFDFIDARATYVEHRGRALATWHWGPRSAPAVLLAHGWGGHASQMRAFVPQLLAAGFRVIAYDQPAHRLSEGRLTGLPDFASAMAAVARSHGGVRAVIAHSLGASAAALALAQGLPLERIVLLSPPSDLTGHSRRFARWYWMPEHIRGVMQAAIEERYGMRWSDLDGMRLAARLRTPALVIHDRGDRVVPWKQGAALARAWPGARLLSTEGLGHGRLLEAERVASAAADFVAGRSAVAGPALPRLPAPAPIL